MTVMTFAKRAVVQRSHVFTRRIWKSSDGRFRVSEFKRCDRTKVYYAEQLERTPTGLCWEILSRHRKKSAAVAACRRAA